MSEPPLSAPPNRWPWPPIIYGGAIVAGLVAGRIVPLPWFSLDLALPLMWVGGALISFGLALDLWAIVTLHRHRTTLMPHKSADRLVTSGPFAWSRNPIYLGNTLLTFGLGLWLGEAWLLLIGLVAALLVTRLAIAREEAHLSARFGEVWTGYAEKVRRWF